MSLLRGFNNTGMGLIDIKFGGAAIAIDAKDNAELIALQKDLGLTLIDKRSTATLEAFQDPKAALVKYQDERLKIDIMTTNLYKSTGKQAEDAGLSKDVAMQWARKRAL